MSAIGTFGLRSVCLLCAAVLGVSMPCAAQEAPQYLVGPSDILLVSVFGEPQLSGKYIVEGDGMFSFPLIGRVRARDLTVRAIESELQSKLAAGYLRNPQVTVSVEQYRSQQVFVMGEVRQPGTLQFTGTMTLVEALARAGSATERAGPEAVVVRPTGGSAPSGPAVSTDPKDTRNEVIRVNLDRLQDGILSENVTLRAGDTVWVLRAEAVIVSGHVSSPGEYVIRRAMTIREVLALAGGITDRGSDRRIQIIRKVDGNEVTVSANLRDPVQPGDTIVVRERFF